MHLGKIAVAGEKGDVVSLLPGSHGVQVAGNGLQALLTVLVAGTYVGGAEKPQPRRVEGTGQGRGLCLGAAQNVLEIAGGGEGGAEQHRSPPF